MNRATRGPRGPRGPYAKPPKPPPPAKPMVELPLAKCRNITCGAVFSLTRPNRFYCTQQCGHDARRDRAVLLLRYMERSLPRLLAKIEASVLSQMEGLRATPPRHDPQEELTNGK